MRYEFEKEGRPVGAAQWEGPGQVAFELTDEAERPKFTRFFAREEVYLGSGHNGEEFQVRRRDWTPWEFERACRTLANSEGLDTHRVPAGPVEFREEVPSR